MEPRSARIRWLVIVGLAVLWVGVILARLSYLQLFHYSDYLAKARKQQERIVPVPPKRGAIYDRNGRALAMSTTVDSCFADPSLISDAPMVARLLAPVLDKPAAELEELLRSPKSLCLAHKLQPEVVSRVEELNLRGIYIQKENHRFYPHGSLAVHVVGFVDPDQHGLAGIEEKFDKEIRGRPQRMLVMADAKRRWYDRSEAAAEPEASIELTLDETIQYVAERELAAAIAETHAKAGIVVVQDPNNGEILALASWPNFDPNDSGSATDDEKVDRAVTAAYEPGSTFKLITLAGALEQGVTNPEEVVDCQMGTILVAGRLIHDWHPFGALTVEQVLANSSDVGTIKIALRLGAPKFDQYIRAFGFGQPTGIDLPGENRGLLRRLENWTPSSIGSLAMGQELNVTPVQLITAVSAIANGGLLYRPHVVRAIRRGAQVDAPAEPAPRRALEATTTATLRHMMEDVLLEGTGKPAQLNGYTVAGKTGTAQKIDPATGRYSPNQYVASFTGFAPVNNPAVTILVALDSPIGPHHGGTVAGPVFRRIAQQVLSYLDVPHDLPVAPEKETTRLRSAPDQSQMDEGIAAAPETTPRGSPSVSEPAPTMALGDSEGVPVPQLIGQSVRGVTEACSRLGLTPLLVGTGVAVEQSPEAGTRVVRGSRISVRFGRAAAVPVAAPEQEPEPEPEKEQ
jgi:cell division protein FtsI (penicillin-binding protein 3)